MNVRDLTIADYREGLLNKKFSALEITQATLAHIKETDKSIGAYLHVNEEGAIRDASSVDVALAEGKELGILAGAPIAIKDCILVEGLPATAASKILETYVAPYNAGAITRLKAEQGVVIGKTNMDEFAMGSSTENSAFQLTKNPHDIDRVPGGSSGGSAASVAAHLALGALGSDTGGSIRQPAAFCGVVGLKTTYGSVSRSGLIAMASSLDQIGPFAKTVDDAALLFEAIRGYDAQDATSIPREYKKNSYNLQNTKQLVVGIPDEYFAGGLDPEVAQSVEEAITSIKSLGLPFKKISLPHTKYALSTYYIVMPAEVSANLSRLDGIRYARVGGAHTAQSLQELYFKNRGEGFGTEAKRRIMLGAFVLSSGYYDAYYEKAQRVRNLISQDFENAFKEVDVILGPTTPTLPFKIGEKTNDPLAMYLSDIFTIPVNLAGLPAISIPVRTRKEKLPVGFQLIGRHFAEDDLLGLGHYYEEITRG